MFSFMFYLQIHCPSTRILGSPIIFLSDCWDVFHWTTRLLPQEIYNYISKKLITNVFDTPFPFYTNQIIYPFLNSSAPFWLWELCSWSFLWNMTNVRFNKLHVKVSFIFKIVLRVLQNAFEDLLINGRQIYWR